MLRTGARPWMSRMVSPPLPFPLPHLPALLEDPRHHRHAQLQDFPDTHACTHCPPDHSWSAWTPYPRPTPHLQFPLQDPSSRSTFACATPGTVARQALLMGFHGMQWEIMGIPGQEYWSGLTFPPPGDLPNPGRELLSLASPALAGGFFTTAPPGKPNLSFELLLNHKCWYTRTSLIRMWASFKLESPLCTFPGAMKHTKKHLTRGQGMNKWMNDCVQDWTDPFHHLMTNRIGRGPDFWAWHSHVFLIFRTQESVSVFMGWM